VSFFDACLVWWCGRDGHDPEPEPLDGMMQREVETIQAAAMQAVVAAVLAGPDGCRGRLAVRRR
jgi:hypothetical protein